MLISKDALRTLHRALEAQSCSCTQAAEPCSWFHLIPMHSSRKRPCISLCSLAPGWLVRGKANSSSYNNICMLLFETNKAVAKKAWNDVTPGIASGNASGLPQIWNQLKSRGRKNTHLKKKIKSSPRNQLKSLKVGQQHPEGWSQQISQC